MPQGGKKGQPSRPTVFIANLYADPLTHISRTNVPDTNTCKIGQGNFGVGRANYRTSAGIYCC